MPDGPPLEIALQGTKTSPQTEHEARVDAAKVTSIANPSQSRYDTDSQFTAEETFRHDSSASACSSLFALPLMAQAPPMSHDNDMAPAGLPKDFNEPMKLFPKALGKFTRPISSKNPEAQAYFDQGFQLMYAFGKLDAARSFREAEKRDPDCAICYWGEAWAWGSYLNGPMQPFEAPYAWAAIQKALKLAPAIRRPLKQP